MSEHNVRRAVHGFVVGSLEPIPFDRGIEQAIDFTDEVVDVFIGNVAALIFQQMIDANKKIGDRMEPCKPRVLLKQVEQGIDGFDRTVEMLIGRLLGHDERAVKPHQSFADREDGSPPAVDGDKSCCLWR